METLTDYTFCSLIEHFRQHAKKKSIRFDEIAIRCCPHLTVWSLHYLAMADGKTVFDLFPHTDSDTATAVRVRDRAFGCPQISESMLVSLEHCDTNDENTATTRWKGAIQFKQFMLCS